MEVQSNFVEKYSHKPSNYQNSTSKNKKQSKVLQTPKDNENTHTDRARERDDLPKSEKGELRKEDREEEREFDPQAMPRVFWAVFFLLLLLLLSLEGFEEIELKLLFDLEQEWAEREESKLILVKIEDC